MVEKVVEVNGAARDEYFCVATFLPLRRWFDVIPFLLLTRRIERQLKRADGLLRYGLRTDFAKKSFWTISVWLNEGYMRGFVMGEPHSEAVRRFRSWSAPGAAFVEYRSKTGKVDWREAEALLKTPTFRYPRS